MSKTDHSVVSRMIVYVDRGLQQLLIDQTFSETGQQSLRTVLRLPALIDYLSDQSSMTNFRSFSSDLWRAVHKQKKQLIDQHFCGSCLKRGLFVDPGAITCTTDLHVRVFGTIIFYKKTIHDLLFILPIYYGSLREYNLIKKSRQKNKNKIFLLFFFFSRLCQTWDKNKFLV